MEDSLQAIGPEDKRWVGKDGHYHPHDYWLSLCGLYELYAFALDRLGDVRGRALLDCGCGQGHTSVMLAKRGARVIAFDTSEQDLATARSLALANGVGIEHRSMPFEHLDLPDASFDVAFGACVLHHVDIPAACRELGRVLKPGARAVFIENSARNPVLMFARRFIVGSFGVPRYGDDHEHPLTARDLDAMRSSFPGTFAVYYPDFLFFRLADFYIFQKRVGFLTSLTATLDRAFGKLPWIREFGYFKVIELTRSR